MKGNKTYLLIAVLAMLSLMTSCGTSDMLPKAEQAHTNVYGSYIELDLSMSFWTYRLSGELIAVDDSTVYVIGRYRDKINYYSIAKQDIYRFRIYHFEPEYPVLSNVGLSVIPVSHGLFSVISLPTNVVAMGVVHGRIKDRASSTGREVPLTEIDAFARFPQGLPNQVVFEDLKPIPEDFFD